MVKMLTVLVSTISNSQVFFSKNISVYAIFNDQSFNDTLTNDIVSFEELGPDFYILNKNKIYLITIAIPRLGKRELILVLFVRLFDLRLFGFVCFLFLLVSGKGYGM